MELDEVCNTIVASFSSESIDIEAGAYCHNINATFNAMDSESRSTLMSAMKLPALSRPMLRARLLAAADSRDTSAAFSWVSAGAHLLHHNGVPSEALHLLE